MLNDKFHTSVYAKPTNNGVCMNGKSECPDRYKRSVIYSYVKRAFTHCNTNDELNKELDRIKQFLVNNSYSNSEIDSVIKNERRKHELKANAIQINQRIENNIDNHNINNNNFNENHNFVDNNDRRNINNNNANNVIISNININNDNNANNNDNNNTNNNHINANTNKIILFYRNVMNSAYKVDEEILTKIIKKHVKPVDNSTTIRLLIFYKNFRSKQLLIKNSPTTRTSPIQQSHLVYQFTCPHEDCLLRKSSYIGLTTTTLSRRLTCHLSDGAPLLHFQDYHNQQLHRNTIEDNTKILIKENDHRRLKILEALYIQNNNPNLNRQTKSYFILPSSRVK